MSIALSPVLAKNADFVAGFSMKSGALKAFDGSQPAADDVERAERTNALWRCVQDLGDASMMLVRDGKRMSVGARAGGVIVEGRDKLNVGLVRGAIKSEPHVDQDFSDTANLTFDTHVRDTVWAVISRIGLCSIDRSYQFRMAGVEGYVTSRSGALTFEGDFLTERDFVGELRAAAEIREEIDYTVVDLREGDPNNSFSITDLLVGYGPTVIGDQWCFDAMGWPAVVPASASFDVLQSYTRVVQALATWCQGVEGGCSCVVLGQDNTKRATFERQDDGSTILTV